MPSRREFIQAGLAVSVVPVAMPIRESARLISRSAMVTSAHHPLYCIVSDVRSPSSIAAAREAELLGLKVVRTNGDITDFWFEDLSRRWKGAPVAIGGLTAHGPLFCLERFGWDHGLRVIFRGTHRFLATGHVEHAISGPSRTVAAVQHAGFAGAHWACDVARLLASCPVDREISSTTVRSAATGPRDDLHDTLMSWVIAPRYVRAFHNHHAQRGA